VERMKKTLIICTFIVLIFLTGCAQNTVKIGWVGPLTGPSAVLGMDSLTAAEIAVEEINIQGGIDGKQVELIFEDDQYVISKAITAYHKLVDVNKVDVIIINTYGSVFALAEEAKTDNIVLIDPLDCNSELSALGNHVFCLATDSESIAEVLASEAKGKAGILFRNTDNFMPLVKDVFVEEYDGEVLIEAYTETDKEFRTVLAKFMEEDVESLVLLGYDETGLAMRQARTLGFEGEFYTTGTITSPPLQELAQGEAEGTTFAFWDAPESSFTDKFIATKGRPPILDLASYPTYDTIKVLTKALESEKDLKQALLEVEEFEGVTGKVKFDKDGAIRIKEEAFILKEGKPEKV
jgi:branched-chain amino acid transport system substrate-binding protein